MTISSGPYREVAAQLGTVAVHCIPTPAAEYWDLVSPIKLFDAMASARPVVVTPRREMAADVRRAEAGVVASGDDEEALAAALATVLDDEPGRAGWAPTAGRPRWSVMTGGGSRGTSRLERSRPAERRRGAEVRGGTPERRRYDLPMAGPTTFDEYLETVPVDRRAALEEMREAIRTAAPEATETIAYQMPAFRSHGGQFLVSFAAYKRHVSLFPATDAVVQALGDALTPYLAGKGTIRFPADQPIPLALVRRIVAVRVEENAARQAPR